jgi:hypothetical protein
MIDTRIRHLFSAKKVIEMRPKLLLIILALCGALLPLKVFALQPPPDGYLYTFLLNGPIWYSSAPEACAAAKAFREEYWNSSNGYGVIYMSWTGDPSPIWFNSLGKPGQCNLRRITWPKGLNAGQQDVSLVSRAPSCESYPANKYSGCGRSVDDLFKVAKAVTDPTRIFHATQQCIALKSCNARCTMDNCDWLNTLVPSFIDPYLQKTGNWRQIELNCVGMGFGKYGELLCARNMAKNHIYKDLIPALVKAGCGTDSDWQGVYEIIKTCTSETMPDNAPPLSSQVAAFQVYRYRQEARQACSSARTAANTPVQINDNAKGKICTPS